MVKKFSETEKMSLQIEKEEQVVRNQYKKLKKAIAEYIDKKEDKVRVEKAFQLAQDLHKGTYRHSGEPYIMHPLRVAQIITEEIKLGTTSILCALLHDVVEDTSISINKIKELFGGEVAKIIYGVTKIKKMFAWDSSEQAENLKKLLLSLTNDHRVILIKLADRLDNMRTLDSLPRRKQLKTASETIQFYVQIAHRLGLSKIKLELEDLYLKHIYPNVYNDLIKKLHINQKVQEKIISKFAKPIKEALERKKIKFRIKNRIKSIYSIWQKMKKKHIELKDIYDLIALRIILTCPVEEEKIICWQILGIVTSFYTPNPNRFRDWISTPKSNGYESLHTTVMNTNGQWIEVQIRTERMHEVSCKGLAAHWQYKEDKPISNMPLLTNWMKNVQKALKEQKIPTIEAMEDVQMSLYKDEINVFNRKGEVKILQEGSTVLDFAIEEINTEGLQCSHALVNQKITPLHQKLKSGDQIELRVNTSQTPKRSWLDFVITPKARKIIKRVFKEVYEATQTKGKNVVEATLNKLGRSLNKKNAELLREFFDEKTISTLYHKIGSKKIQLKELETFIKFIETAEKSDSSGVMTTNKVHIDPDMKKLGIIVNEEEKQSYTLASCCDPIPFEEIFGVISFHQKVKVHRIDCTNALYILTHQGNKIVKASWNQQKRRALLNLTVVALNQEDLRKKIIKTLRSQCSIESIVSKKQKDFMKHTLIIKGKNAEQFNQIIHEVQHLQGVIDIRRQPKSNL